MNINDIVHNLRHISLELEKMCEVNQKDDEDFIQFAKQIEITISQGGLQKFSPYDYQKRIVNYLERSDKLIINSARQIGLTTILFLYTLYESSKYPNYITYWGSNSFTNTQDTFSHANWYLNSPMLKQLIKSHNKDKIEFKNGSIIRAVSINDATYRGVVPINRLIIDNAAYVSHRHFDEFWSYHDFNNIRQVVIAGCPNDNKGKFYEIWSNGNIEWHKMMLPYYECPTYDKIWMSYMRSQMTEKEFRQFYCCEFIWENENKWRPIETAPKNGEYILISCGDSVSSVGGVQIAIACYNQGIWTPMFSSGGYCGAKYWMPLPKID